MLPPPAADNRAAPSALSKHGGAAIRAGGGRGPAVTKPSTAPAGLAGGPATPRVEILQGKNNAGFGKNGAALVALAETTRRPARCSVSAECRERPGTAIAFATYKIRGSASVLFQAALPQNRDCFSSSHHVTGQKRAAVRPSQEPAWNHLPGPAQSSDSSEPRSTKS